MITQMQEETALLASADTTGATNSSTPHLNRTEQIKTELSPVNTWLNNQSEWILARVGELNLLIPQLMVQALSHIQKSHALEYHAGFLVTQQNDAAKEKYLVPHSQFKPLDHVPSERFIATNITSPLGEPILWCWDNVRMLDKQHMHFFPLPKRLTTAVTPFKYATELNTSQEKGQLALYANMDTLYTYMLNTNEHIGVA